MKQLPDEPYFHDEVAAAEFIENLLWPNGLTCPKCQSDLGFYEMRKRRPGLLRCRNCKADVSIKKNTFMENSLVPFPCWTKAIWWLLFTDEIENDWQLSQRIGTSWRTARFVRKRIEGSGLRRKAAELVS